MRVVGMVLIVVGFLVGALATTVETDDTWWWLYGPAVAVAVAGVVVARAATRRAVRSEGVLEASLASAEEALERVARSATSIRSEAREMDPYEVRHRIDEVFVEDLDRFVVARESLAHVYGLQQYADVMSPFAAGERALNRAWTTSADGYVHEVAASLERAEEHFATAVTELERVRAAGPRRVAGDG